MIFPGGMQFIHLEKEQDDIKLLHTGNIKKEMQCKLHVPGRLLHSKGKWNAINASWNVAFLPTLVSHLAQLN